MKVRIQVPHSHARRVTSYVLLVVGAVCLGIYSYAYLYRTAYQLYASWQFDREVAQPEPAPTAHPDKRHPVSLPAASFPAVSLPSVLPDPDRGSPEAPVASGILGRISIPRLHLSAIVEEGVDSGTLARAVGHVPGTAVPGEPGNIGIAGHRDTFFRALKDLQPQDRIDFTTRAGHFHYTVESLRVVEPDDVAVLKPTGGQVLTIVTCFPFEYIGNAPRRFIVHAVATE